MFRKPAGAPCSLARRGARALTPAERGPACLSFTVAAADARAHPRGLTTLYVDELGSETGRRVQKTILGASPQEWPSRTVAAVQ